jgi:hypothetical protein
VFNNGGCDTVCSCGGAGRGAGAGVNAGVELPAAGATGDVKISFRFSGLVVSGAGTPVPLNGDENKPMLELGSP